MVGKEVNAEKGIGSLSDGRPTSTACFGVEMYPENKACIPTHIHQGPPSPPLHPDVARKLTGLRRKATTLRILHQHDSTRSNPIRAGSTHLANRPLAAMTPFTPVCFLIRLASSKSQTSPLPTHGTSPRAEATANSMLGRETG
jgi:hypothetical protein